MLLEPFLILCPCARLDFVAMDHDNIPPVVLGDRWHGQQQHRNYCQENPYFPHGCLP
jgi:hypothetical protein